MTLNSASAKSWKSHPSTGDERWGRKTDLGFSLQGPVKGLATSQILQKTNQLAHRQQGAIMS